MKYLPLRDFDEITNALNFDTADCHVLGGCDVYTTKAAGGDKKLYKNIEKSLESQYASVLSFSASLSSQQAKAAGPSLNLSRASPFGSLSQISSRRTFAYLIATLNASHPDYDFSYLLRPSDFKREKSLKRVINTLDTTLYNLRPQSTMSASSGEPHQTVSLGLDESSASPSAAAAGAGGERWNPRMWHLIDQEMSLKECSIYAYTPEEDPYDGEEGALWSFNYFFFNKAKKRVCYLYLRGVSNIDIAASSSSSFWAAGLKTPLSATTYHSGAATPAGAGTGGGGGGGRSKRGASGTWSISSAEMGHKRACYWLGDRAGDAEPVDGEDEEEMEMEAMEAAAAAGDGAGDDDAEAPPPHPPEEEHEHADADDHRRRRRRRGARGGHAALAGGAPPDHGEEEEEEEEEEDRHFTAFSSTDDARSESPCKGRARGPGGGARGGGKSRGRARSGSSSATFVT